jgi:hypothetical protein
VLRDPSPRRALPVLGVLALCSVARADESRAFRIESRTESTCAAAREFAVQLGARTPRVRPAVGAEPAFDFTLEVTGAVPKLVGRLSVREPSGATTIREVPGTSCQEVVSALALIAAILVDPDASTAELPARATPPPPPPAPPPPPWWFGVGFGVGVESAPTPVPAATLSAELVLAADRRRPYGPWFSLSVLRSSRVTVSRSEGDAVFGWTAARLQGCILRWPTSGPVALQPCVSFEAGALQAAGQRTIDQASVTVPWLASGVGLHLAAVPVTPLALVLDAAAVFPWQRDRYYFDPDDADSTAFEVPAVGLSGRFSLIVHLL